MAPIASDQLPQVSAKLAPTCRLPANPAMSPASAKQHFIEGVPPLKSAAFYKCIAVCLTLAEHKCCLLANFSLSLVPHSFQVLVRKFIQRSFLIEDNLSASMAHAITSLSWCYHFISLQQSLSSHPPLPLWTVPSL